MTTPAIIAAGGLIVDNVVTADGAVKRRQIGGNAIYAAAGARLWCDSVGIAGVVPCDYPRDFLDRLSGAGLMLDGVSVADDPVPCSEWFFHRPDGSRADHLHATEDEADRFGMDAPRVPLEVARAFEAYLRVRPAPGPGFAAFRASHPVTVAGIPAGWRGAEGVHAGPSAPPGIVAFLGEARDVAGRVTWDPGFAAGLLDAAAADRLLGMVDAVLPSAKELAVLAPGLTAPAALRGLLDRGAPLAVGKLGAEGSLLAGPGGLQSVPAFPVAVAPDPTGAGDAFCGGFLAGWIATGDPLAGAACGTVSASFAVEAFGPDALLAANRAEARRRLAAVAAALPAGAPATLQSLITPEPR